MEEKKQHCHEHHEHEHHDHEHHHGHAHEHDHEHHHHHEHDHECHDHNCTDPSHHHHHHHEDGTVEISHHEGAIIGALRGTMPTANYGEAEAQLAAQMRDAGRRITEAGGIIGHIKFVLSSAGRCGQISVTGESENIRHFDGTTSRVEGVAIVFAVEDDLLVSILEETIGSLFA